jgi:hypothetical protein
MLDRPALTLLLVLACSPTPVTTDGGTGDPGTTGAAETGTTAAPTTTTAGP